MPGEGIMVVKNVRRERVGRCLSQSSVLDKLMVSEKVSQCLFTSQIGFKWRGHNKPLHFSDLKEPCDVLKSLTYWCFMQSYSTEWHQWWKRYQSGQCSAILFSSQWRRCNILQAVEDLAVDIHHVLVYSAQVNMVGSQWISRHVGKDGIFLFLFIINISMRSRVSVQPQSIWVILSPANLHHVTLVGHELVYWVLSPMTVAITECINLHRRKQTSEYQQNQEMPVKWKVTKTLNF